MAWLGSAGCREASYGEAGQGRAEFGLTERGEVWPDRAW